MQHKPYHNLDIKRALESDLIAYAPITSSSFTEAGLGLSLGYYFYTLSTHSDKATYNAFDPDDILQRFIGPYHAMAHHEYANLLGLRPQANIHGSHPVIPIHPGESILTHTHEFLGAGPSLEYQCSPVGSWKLNGIEISILPTPAVTGVSRLTVWLSNRNHAVMFLPVGARLAEVTFWSQSAPNDKNEQLQAPTANSSHISSDIETAIKVWSPDLMLPKPWTELTALPTKIEGLSYD